MDFTYSYSEGTKDLSGFIEGKASNPNEVMDLLDKLTKPKSSVSISNSELDYIDFWCLEDGQIEMEIMQRGNDDFAVLDVPMAKQVVEVVFRSSGKKLVRDTLQELPIKWI